LRKQRRSLEDGPRHDVNAKALDDRVHALQGVLDRAAIERVSGHLLQGWILNSYACRRTCQRTNAVTGEKGSLYSLKSDATAGAYDEKLGHVLPNSYLF
jgi:hypothetical protein